MKKGMNILMCLLILLSYFMPFSQVFKVEAATPYSVVMVSGTSGNKTVGSYSNYQDAVNAMNKQNSTSTSVATVYKNGTVINSKYAIFKLKPSTGTFNVFQDLNDSSAYTYINPSSMLDTAFIDYNESKNMVQIMVNGFKGWITASAGTITPISLYSANIVEINASGLNFRSGPSTSSSSIGAITCKNCQFAYTSKQTSGGYTWYKITYDGKEGWVAGDPEWLKETTGNSLNTYYYRYDNGNLLHRFAYHTGTTESDYFTNLGPSPTYLSVGTHYYSFDGGIYLYTSLTSMLDDYRNNTYKNALNKDDPNYPYYLYAPAKTVTKATATDLDKQITNKNSKMYGSGKIFKEVEAIYGVNALSMFSVAKTESASGTSKLALEKNNLFGMGAYDSCPFDCARSYASIKDSIIDYAKNFLGSYATAGASYYFGSHQGTKGSGRTVKYASDPLSGEKAAANTYITDKNDNGMKDYKSNTIAVSKFGKANIVVYKDASTKTPIYTMRNSNSSFEVYNVPVNVIDREGDFYKIYTDSNDYQYGYVKVSDFNITNNQPVITASDKTINLNADFNYMDGVSASDKEDGNLTDRITYTGEVKTNQAGTYKVTYKVTDNSNFSATKTVNITVKGSNEPVINASDKEIAQYTQFDPMDGVTASIDGQDITDEITYDSDVNPDKQGKYKVTYKVTSFEGKEITKTITVTVIANEKPEINALDKTIYLNSDFDPKEGVTATDKEDGDLTSSIEVIKNEVKTDTIGDYKVEYKVTDKANQVTTKEITVTVIEKVIQKADGKFYLDYLKEVNGNLQIKGYNTIQGIDNTLDNKITYELIFVNQNTHQQYKQELTRITDESEMTLPIVSSDGKDYKYSWFVGNIDVTNLPAGDYDVYIASISDDYYSVSILQNMLLNPETSGYVADGKYITIITDYMQNDIPINFIVRDEELGVKETSTDSNQYSLLEKIEFKEDLLHLRGASYSVNVDMRKGVNLERKIIFENVDTFDKYTYDLGYLESGTYDINLVASDNFGKLKKLAWYDKEIDISNLPKGKYAIYITNKSNISDYGELSDVLFADLSKAQGQIAGKEYKFSLNEKLRNRIELEVK